MLLDLHHQVMDVDKLSTNRQTLEGRLRENLLESMVVLNQLGQSTLWNIKQYKELHIISYKHVYMYVHIHVAQRRHLLHVYIQ